MSHCRLVYKSCIPNYACRSTSLCMKETGGYAIGMHCARLACYLSINAFHVGKRHSQSVLELSSNRLTMGSLLFP